MLKKEVIAVEAKQLVVAVSTQEGVGTAINVIFVDTTKKGVIASITKEVGFFCSTN